MGCTLKEKDMRGKWKNEHADILIIFLKLFLNKGQTRGTVSIYLNF